MEKVNHPTHYGGDNPYEAIKVIEAWQVDFHIGNVLKYLQRAGKKGDELEDLKKAKWYLERKINKLENETQDTELSHEFATGTSNDVRESCGHDGFIHSTTPLASLRYTFGPG